MTSLTYYDYEGVGQYAKEHLKYSQAVRIGDRIECSGQGGWKADVIPMSLSDGLEEQIDQAFSNLDLAIRTAGGKGISQVYRITSLHIRLSTTPETTEYMSKAIAKWFPDHKPIWTAFGVEALGLPEMLVEIEAAAHDPTEG